MSWCGSLVLLLPGLFIRTSELAGSRGQCPGNSEVGVTVCRAGAGWIGRVTYVVLMEAALVGLAVAGLLAACGGHAKVDSPGTAPSGGGIQAYADCLRQ